MKNRGLEVKQNEEKPVAAEVFAQAIVDMANAMKKLNATRLTRAAIVTLIHDRSRLPKYQVELVLNNLDTLEANWLKKNV